MFSKLLNQAATLCSSAAERIDTLSEKEIPMAINAVKQSTMVTLTEAQRLANKAKSEVESAEFKAKVSHVSKSIFGNIGKAAGTIAKTAVKIGTVPATDIKEGFIHNFSK
jgi:hypothetical protein